MVQSAKRPANQTVDRLQESEVDDVHGISGKESVYGPNRCLQNVLSIML